MLNFIKNIFKPEEEDIELPVKTKSNDWLEALFELVLEALAQNKTVQCKIFNLKEDGFLVKVKGLYSRLPIDRMPWQYPDLYYWNVIWLTLRGKMFNCKVVEASRAENGRFCIELDATGHSFRKINLVDDAEYTGIILDKKPDGVIIDIGSHFHWKYGPLTGFLRCSDFADSETFQSCEAGQKLVVAYNGENENGIVFSEPGHIDLHAKYVGKIVWVKICKAENTAPYFLVEGKYKAVLPVNKLIYPERKKRVNRMKNQWDDGEVINCAVTDFRPERGLILKWIDDSPQSDIDWHSYNMLDFIGRRVNVNVYKLDGKTIFRVNDLYPATMVGKYSPNNFSENDVICCQVRSVDFNEQCFTIKIVDADKESTNEKTEE